MMSLYVVNSSTPVPTKYKLFVSHRTSSSSTIVAMDPLSITTNILTLLGVIWGVVLSIVRIVSSCRDYPTELSYVVNQLELAKMTRHFWSENLGISKGESQHSQHERLVDPEILAPVYNTLSN